MRKHLAASFAAVAVLLGLDVVWLLGQAGADSELAFSTYFGGSNSENATAVRVDADGNLYLAGSTRSTDLPTRGTLFPPPASTSVEVGFLSKRRPDGSVVYATYLPRPVVALAVDRAGNAIVADNLPISGRFSGQTGDVVITKIDANGLELLYSVRLAGSRLEQAAGLAVDHAGAVVVIGQTSSPDFPLVNAIQPTVQTSESVFSAKSGFITKLDAEGRIMFSTGWGGRGDDAVTAVAVDQALDIYVAGTTASPDFATSVGALRRTLANTVCTSNLLDCVDVFVSKLSPDGQTIVYSTLFGGTRGETAQALAVDDRGSVHLAGTTASSDLPLRRAFQTRCDSLRQSYGCSGYLAKLDPGGAALEYATYFGSFGEYIPFLGQTVNGLSIDRDGNLLAVGMTRGNDLPLVRPLQPLNGGGPVFKSTDGGATWSASSSGLSGGGVWELASGGPGTSRVYAGALGHTFRSDDQGRATCSMSRWRHRRRRTSTWGRCAACSTAPMAARRGRSRSTSIPPRPSQDPGPKWSPSIRTMRRKCTWQSMIGRS